jgi:hypothetical protein
LVAPLGTVPLDVPWTSHFSAQTLAQANSLAFSQRLVSEVECIRELPRAEDIALVAKMRQYADVPGGQSEGDGEWVEEL